MTNLNEKLAGIRPFLGGEYSETMKEAIGRVAVWLTHTHRFTDPASRGALGANAEAVALAVDLVATPEFKRLVREALAKHRQALELAEAVDGSYAENKWMTYKASTLQWDIGKIGRVYNDDFLQGVAVFKISTELPLEAFTDPRDLAAIAEWDKTFFHCRAGLSRHFQSNGSRRAEL